MLKIERFIEGNLIGFALSGRIEAENLAQLQSLFNAEQQKVILDLKEVTLVDRDAVRFLAHCESEGTRLKDCPAYIREWTTRERDER